MSDKVAGTVRGVYSKDYKGKKLWSFRLENNSMWFRTGEVPPCLNDKDSTPLEKGMPVAFVANGPTVERGSLEKTTVEVATAATATTTSAPSTATRGKAGGTTTRRRTMSKDDYWAQKDAYEKKVRTPMIEYAHVQNCATQLVTTAAQVDALAFGNMTKGARLDFMVKCVEEVAGQLLEKLEAKKKELEDNV